MQNKISPIDIIKNIIANLFSMIGVGGALYIFFFAIVVILMLVVGNALNDFVTQPNAQIEAIHSITK